MSERRCARAVHFGAGGGWPARSLVLIVLLCTAAGLVSARSLAQAPGSATVTSSDGLNLRAAAGSQAAIVTVVPAGASVTITGDPSSDGWFPVAYGSLSGWVDGGYLAFTPANPAAPPASHVSTGGSAVSMMVVNTDALNLRADPDERSRVIATVVMGAVVQVTGAAVDNWLPVTVNGVSGWMDADYLTPNQPESPATQNLPAGVPVTLGLTSSAGQPLAGHAFTLAGQQGLPSQTQMTDQLGRAAFSQVAPGIYSLSEAAIATISLVSTTINGASAGPGQLFELQAGGTYQIDLVDAVSVPPTPAPLAPPAAPPPTGTPRPSLPRGPAPATPAVR